MTITLHQLSGSPYAWRVLLALEHKGAPFERRNVDAAAGEHKSEPYLALNPRGKIPVLTHDDLTLYESIAMLEYIEEILPEGPRLFPDGARERAHVRRLVCEVDHYWSPEADRVVRNVYFRKEPDWDHAEIEAGRDALLHELAHFEREAQAGRFGETPGAAHFAIYPFLAHLTRYELRKPDLGLTDAIGPGLRAVMAAVEALPCFERTFPAHWRS